MCSSDLLAADHKPGQVIRLADQSRNKRLAGLFRSTDLGATWNPMALPTTKDLVFFGDRNANKALDAAEIPAGRVYDPEDIVNDMHYKARNMIEQWKLPDGKPMRIPAVIPKLTETPGGTRWIGPKLGEHTAEVLAGLGYSDARVAELRGKKVI